MSSMTTQNISLTPEQDAFLDEILKAGEYRNESETMRDGIRALQQRRNWVCPQLPDTLQYAHVVRHRGAAHVEDAAQPRAGDLHVGRGASKLHGGKRVHGDAGCADRVALGFKAAGWVDRQAAARLSRSFRHGG